MWSKPSPPSPTAGTPPTTSEFLSGPPPSSPSTIAARQKNPGRRMGQIIKLKPESVDKYKELHAAVWPEVLRQLRRCNIEDYAIFHDPTSGLLFASFRYVGYDYAGDMERMRESPKVREWWAVTDAMQESLNPGAKGSAAEGGEDGVPAWWTPVEQVFYMP